MFSFSSSKASSHSGRKSQFFGISCNCKLPRPQPMGSRLSSVEIRAQGKGADTQRGVGRNEPEFESVGLISGHLSPLVTGDPLSKNWTRVSVELLNLCGNQTLHLKCPSFPFRKYKWKRANLISYFSNSARLKTWIDTNAYEYAINILLSSQKCLFRGQNWKKGLKLLCLQLPPDQIHDIWFFSAYRGRKENLCLVLAN